MADNDVIINFVGDTSGLAPVEDAMDGIIAKEGEVGAAWKKASTVMTDQTKTAIVSNNKLAKSIDALGVAAKSMDKAVVAGAYKQYLKDIQAQLGLTNKELITYVTNARDAARAAIFTAGTDEEIDQLTMSIEAMNEQLTVLSVNEDAASTSTQSLKSRLREAKEQLTAMADAGLQGTPAFLELQQRAGELNDEIGDLNATISGLGSDTANLDGVISAVSGMAGGFAVAQGAAALLGNESEDMQKALLKVNAAMAILQGLQQIQNVLQAESAASLLFARIQTSALAAGQQFLAVTTLESAAATTVLRGALIASGIGAIIVVLALAAQGFSNMNVEIESSADRMDRLTKKADIVYEALQKLSKINQVAIDRDIDITKSKEMVGILEAQGKGVKAINDEKKVGLKLEGDRLRDELLNIESAKEIAADVTQFTERELAIKTDIYSNDKAQLVLDIETNKVLRERSLKSSSASADAEVARKKLAIVQNQVDSLASIKAVSDAEIVAIRKKQKEESNPDKQLTAGEIAKIAADANLAVAENRKQLQLDLLKIETAGIEAKVLLSKKGSEAEYNNRLELLEKERNNALSDTLVSKSQRLQIEADFTVKKRELTRAFNEQEMQDEISHLDASLDEFGLNEGRKLELSVRRLEMQQALETSQAEGNIAKIREINAKYDAQVRETKKASFEKELADRIAFLDTFGAIDKAANERILSLDKATFDERKIANRMLLQEELFRYNLQEAALKKQLDNGLILQKDYDLALQVINNNRNAANIQAEEQNTADTIREINKRTAAIQGVFSVFQKGLSATIEISGLSVALIELQNFGAAANDVFDKIKAGTITTQEGLKEVTVAAISGIQSSINQIFADSTTERKQQLDEQLNDLKANKANELDNADLTERQKFEINKRYADKEREVKIAAFKADKEAKKEQAVINGLLAVTQAFASNPFPYSLVVAGIVAASTALQINKINNAKVPKFRHGKVDIQGEGTTTSDSIHAMISKGESVINAGATVKWKPALEAINTNKFEKYLTEKLAAFIYPTVPDSVKPAAMEIDYNKLGNVIAEKMKGLIPSPTQVHNTIDNQGLHSFVIDGNNRTEYKNKRYSTK